MDLREPLRGRDGKRKGRRNKLEGGWGRDGAAPREKKEKSAPTIDNTTLMRRKRVKKGVIKSLGEVVGRSEKYAYVQRKNS